MDRSDKKAVKKYLKFLQVDRKSRSAYIDGFSPRNISLIKRYLKKGILRTTDNSLLLLLQNIKLKNKPLDNDMMELKNYADMIHMFRSGGHVYESIKELKKYEDLITKKSEESLKRFIEKLGYYNICDDNDRFQTFLKTLTLDQFKNILITLNTKLNRLEREDKKKRVTELNKVGTMGMFAFIATVCWYGPSSTVIDDILQKLLDALKSLDDRKDQATLLYYTLNLLHMFKDGNGRTTRLLYDSVAGEYQPNNLDWYFHSAHDEKIYDEEFEEKKDIMLIKDLTVLLSKYNALSLDILGMSLPQELEGKNIETVVSKYQMQNTIPMADEIIDELSSEEQFEINHILFDNIKTGYYEIGGLTMLVMTAMKGQLQEIMDKNPNPNKLSFQISHNDKLFETWNIDDYRRAYKIGNTLKREMFIHLIEIFTNPEKYQEDGTNVKDILMKKSGKIR